MDNTELHYLTFDPDEIWNQMMINYVNAGGDILYPGDEKEMLLRSVQADIVQIFAGVDNALRMQTLRYAIGPYLDIIGELRNCARIAASAARATVTITTNATGESDVLEAGSTMTADGRLFYALVEDFVLTGYQQTATVEVECTEAGSAGNGLLAGAEMGLSITNEGINSIVVASDASGGNEEEEDEAYRERIREYGLASITTGPYQQYESVAKSVSSEILDARALNLTGGSVGIYLIFATDTGKEAIKAAVLAALTPDDVRPLTDTVSVYEATAIPYILDVQYESDGSSATTAAIGKAAEEYQAWQDEVIGRAFNPDRFMAMLYQSGCTRVSWIGDSSFDGTGDVTYTEIEPNERCKGTITLTAASS